MRDIDIEIFSLPNKTFYQPIMIHRNVITRDKEAEAHENKQI